MHALDDERLWFLLEATDYDIWGFKGCHMISQMHRNSDGQDLGKRRVSSILVH